MTQVSMLLLNLFRRGSLMVNSLWNLKPENIGSKRMIPHLREWTVFQLKEPEIFMLQKIWSLITSKNHVLVFEHFG